MVFKFYGFSRHLRVLPGADPYQFPPLYGNRKKVNIYVYIFHKNKSQYFETGKSIVWLTQKPEKGILGSLILTSDAYLNVRKMLSNVKILYKIQTSHFEICYGARRLMRSDF